MQNNRILKNVYLEQLQLETLENHQRKLQRMKYEKTQLKQELELYQKDLSIHKDRQRRAKSGTQFRELNRQYEIDKANQLMFHKLNNIYKKQINVADNQRSNETKLFIKNKQATIQRQRSISQQQIQKQNDLLVHRIIKQEPTVDSRNDMDNHERLIKLLQKYHESKPSRMNLLSDQKKKILDLSNPDIYKQSVIVSIKIMEFKVAKPFKKGYYLIEFNRNTLQRRTVPEKIKDFRKITVDETFQFRDLQKNSIIQFSIYGIIKFEEVLIGSFQLDLKRYYFFSGSHELEFDLNQKQENQLIQEKEKKRNGYLKMIIKVESNLNNYLVMQQPQLSRVKTYSSKKLIGQQTVTHQIHKLNEDPITPLKLPQVKNESSQTEQFQESNQQLE